MICRLQEAIDMQMYVCVCETTIFNIYIGYREDLQKFLQPNRTREREREGRGGGGGQKK